MTDVFGLEVMNTELFTASNDMSMLVAVAAYNLNYSAHSSERKCTIQKVMKPLHINCRPTLLNRL